MASVFKRTRPIPDGATIFTSRGKQYATWTDSCGRSHKLPLDDNGRMVERHWRAAYIDAEGNRITRSTKTADKQAARSIADRWEREAHQRRSGLIDARQERMAVEMKKPIGEHIDQYNAALLAKGNTQKHCKETADMVRKVAAGCDAERTSDLTASAVQQFIGNMRETGSSHRTCNAYLQAVKSFTRWLQRDRRAPDDPLAGMAKYNEEADRRKIRREATQQELDRLIRCTEARTEGNHRLKGPDRAMLYRLAIGTGFRADELRSLSPASFDLEADPPTVTVEAAYSKRRKKDVQPISRALADLVRPWLEGKVEGKRMFAGLPRNSSRMLRGDLAAARKQWVAEASDEAERKSRQESDFLLHETDVGDLDFHATRHTYISQLVASGVNVKVAQELARHSTAELTISRYSHARLHDLKGAVESIGVVVSIEAEAAEPQMRATGTENVSANDSARTAQGGLNRQDAASGPGGDQGERRGEKSDSGEPQPVTLRVVGKQKAQPARGGKKRRAGDSNPQPAEPAPDFE